MDVSRLFLRAAALFRTKGRSLSMTRGNSNASHSVAECSGNRASRLPLCQFVEFEALPQRHCCHHHWEPQSSTSRHQGLFGSHSAILRTRSGAPCSPFLTTGRRLDAGRPRSSSSSSSAAAAASQASSAATTARRELSSREYAALSEFVLESLVSQLEALIDESEPEAATADWEVEYSQGVLNLKVPPTGTYVLNKQPPNKQIWLSSPNSGPKKFDYTDDDGVWICKREGEEDTVLHELLGREWSKVFGHPVELLQDLRGGAAVWNGAKTCRTGSLT